MTPGRKATSDRATLLAGRGSELARLDAAAERATAGRGSLTIVSGPAGIGKTTLLTEAASGRVGRFATSFVTVGRWSADAPLSVWARTLQSLVRTGLAARESVQPLVDRLLGTAPADMSATGEPISGDRLALFDDVVGEIVAAAAQRPLALFLDDVHRADIAMLMLLGFLVDELPTASISLTVAYRSHSAPEPVASALADLDRSGDHIRLAGLDGDALVDLVRARLGETTVDGDELLRCSGGNPLFALQLATHTPHESMDLGALYRDRARHLSEPARSLLGAAAVLGGEFDEGPARALVDMDRPTAAAATDEAVAAGLLVRSGSTVRYGHDLVHETAYTGLGDTQRRHLHHRAIAVLDQDDEVPSSLAAELARHVVAGGVGGDRARHVLVSAARAAVQAGAYEQGCRWWEAAIERIEPDDDAQRVDTYLALAGAQAQAGDRAASRASVLVAADTAVRLGPDRTAEVLLEIDSHNSGGHVDVEVVERLEELLRAPISPSTATQVRARLARWLTFTEATAHRQELADAARRGVDALDSPLARARTLYHLGVASAGAEPVDQRMPLIDTVVAAARASGDHQLMVHASTLQLGLLLEAGRGRAFRNAVDRYAQLLDDLGQRPWRWHVSLLRATIASLDGRADEADRLLDEAVTTGRRFGSHEFEPVLAACLGGQLAMRGLLGTVADAIGENATTYREFPIARCAHPLALADAGRVAEAAVQLDLIIASGLCDRPTDSTWLAGMWALAMTAAAVGDAAHRATIRAALEPFGSSVARMSREGMGCAGLVPFALGAMAEADGELDEARAWYDEAFSLAADLSAPVLAADVRVALARVAAATGAPDAEQSARQAIEAGEAYGVRLPLHAPPRPARPVVGAAEASNGMELASLVRVGDEWTVEFRGVTATVRHSVGIGHLAALLAQPARDVHVLELVGAPRDEVDGDLGPELDEQARQAYRRRIESLRAELDVADERGDATASAGIQAELDTLVRQLSSAFGLGGRPRPAGAAAERARFAVSKAVRVAVRRIGEVHAPLGEHLAVHVQTGLHCAYRSDSVRWRVDREPR